MFKKMNKRFVSAIDRFLVQFDKTHAPSLSQQAEIEKYKKIFQLRDHPMTKPMAGKEKLVKGTIQSADIWKNF